MIKDKDENYLKYLKIRRKLLIRQAVILALLSFGLFYTLNEKSGFSQIFLLHRTAHFFGSGAKPYVQPEEGEATISFIDVEQGDCELIRTKDFNILIDSGEAEYGDRVIGFLRYSGVKRLDLIIVTHPHSDHYGSMYKVLRSFEVGELIMPELPAGTIPRGAEYERFAETVKGEGISARSAEAGESIVLSDNCRLEILAPLYDDYDELNDCSVVAKFVFGNDSFLFAGDTQELAELDIISSGADVSADVLKCGHHGSAGSSSADFLEAVSPRVAVFEAASFNYYRHPSAETVERLSAAGCEACYSTANNGNIVMLTDGADIKVFTEKGEALRLDDW